MGIEKALAIAGRNCWISCQTVRSSRSLANLRRISTLVSKDAPVPEKPSKFSGIVSKWVDYWTAVYNDYRDVTLDTVKTVKEKPAKGILYAVLMGAAVYLASNNPTEEDFRDAYLKSCNDFIFVAPAIRNPETDLHLKSIELFYNQDIVERISFGIFSIIWVKDYSSQVAAYKSLCKYLTPALGTYRARILDVGFLGRWWVLDEVMKDCDINRYEWAE